MPIIQRGNTKLGPFIGVFSIPAGLRGLMLIALIAASMSTFDSNVNWISGLFTRDIYQKYFRPQADTKELIRATWVFILVLVTCGFLFAYSLKSINDVWGWIIMGLMTGMLVPEILRFYWWRFNGYGFAIGTGVGCVGAIAQRLIIPDLDERYIFLLILAVGLIGSIVSTYLTKPTDRKVLEHFYRTTRPFGFWGSLKDTLEGELLVATRREHRNDIIAVPFTLLWQITLFLWPMLLVIQADRAFGYVFALFCVGLAGMYFFWYRNLPAADAEIIDNVAKSNEDAGGA